MIILFPVDAQAVVGYSPTHPWAALEPIPLKDGTYMLHEDVLKDPAHADVHDILAACDIMLDTGLIEFKPTDTPAEKAAYESAKLDYAEAGTRTVAKVAEAVK